MKMVKSLLLGSAAGVVAVTMGQAADLPVKAKPVEYVKVCSLYGAGFYYMPGTDLCIKVGGWVRFEAMWGFNGSTVATWNGDANQRTTNNFVERARGYITADVRSQTDYGTARSYIAVGISTTTTGFDTAANQFSANRAFIQWAGFTAGVSQSFYDYYSVPAAAFSGNYPASDTGDPGWLVFGYTAQLGNGLSATLSLEERRLTQIINQNAVSVINAAGSETPGAFFSSLGGAQGAFNSSVSGAGSLFPAAGAYGGNQVGDIVGNIRLDQTWGGAQIMAALHDVNANYYSSNVLAAGTTAAPVVGAGHPNDRWGWAAGVGIKINTPFFGQGDYFQGQFNATEGALRYLFFSPNGNWGATKGASSTFGVLSDAVYGGCTNVAVFAECGQTNTKLELTTAYGFNASYEHFWTSQWHTSAYGGYYEVKYNTLANAMLCAGSTGGLGGAGTEFGTGVGGQAVAQAGCNNNWSMFFIGSRTQWDVTKTLYLGVEVLYEQMKGGSLPATTVTGAANTLAAYSVGGSTTLESHASNWSVRFRAHRDFLP